MKNVKYYYIFVFYDVNESRVNKVFKVCKKYLNHFQNSVFRGNITPGDTIKLKNEIKKIINTEEDFVSFVEVLNEDSYKETSLGISKRISGENFIL